MSDDTTQLIIGGVVIGVLMLIIGVIIYYAVVWISDVDGVEDE